jgi:integrase
LFEGTVSLGFVGGKRRRKTVYGATKTACLEEMDRLRAQARAGTVPDAGRVTVGQLLERWLESSKPKLAPATFEVRESNVNTHVLPRLGAVPLSKLNSLHVEGFYADMVRDGVGPPQSGPPPTSCPGRWRTRSSCA